MVEITTQTLPKLLEPKGGKIKKRKKKLENSIVFSEPNLSTPKRERSIYEEFKNLLYKPKK